MAIKKEGLECLLIREGFDYTKWQRDYFDKYSLDDFLGKAAEFDKVQPFKQ
jgi:hypothetical protein